MSGSAVHHTTYPPLHHQIHWIYRASDHILFHRSLLYINIQPFQLQHSSVSLLCSLEAFEQQLPRQQTSLLGQWPSDNSHSQFNKWLMYSVVNMTQRVMVDRDAVQCHGSVITSWLSTVSLTKIWFVIRTLTYCQTYYIPYRLWAQSVLQRSHL